MGTRKGMMEVEEKRRRSLDSASLLVGEWESMKKLKD